MRADNSCKVHALLKAVQGHTYSAGQTCKGGVTRDREEDGGGGGARVRDSGAVLHHSRGVEGSRGWLCSSTPPGAGPRADTTSGRALADTARDRVSSDRPTLRCLTLKGHPID
jgi:hypothetical protein